jgi:cation transport regulator
MPYETLSALPESVRAHLPRHAQEIYREAFNSAWDQYAERDDRESVAHKVAWAAVKQTYEKRGERWVRKWGAR